jgi:hypothetical protein
MLNRYGQEVIDELRRLSKTTKKYTIADFKELEQYYKNKIKDFGSER